MSDSLPQSIPPAPRSVRRGATATHRLSWLLAGVALALVGGTLLLLGRDGAWFDDVALDSEATRTAGTIVACEPVADAQFALTVQFTVAAQVYMAACYAAARHAPGPCTVEFLARQPAIARMLGTTRAHERPWLTRLPARLPGSVLAAGVALVMLWLRAGADRRLLLRDGRAVATEDLRVQPSWFGRGVRLEFGYRDREQRRRHGSVACLAGSALARAAASSGDLIVVHPHAHPARYCLTTRDAFEA